MENPKELDKIEDNREKTIRTDNKDYKKRVPIIDFYVFDQNL